MEDLLHFIASSFWMILLMLTLVSSRNYRIAGIVLLAIQVTFGFVIWVVLAVVAITLVSEMVKGTKGKQSDGRYK